MCWIALVLGVVLLINYNATRMQVRGSGLGSARTAGAIAAKGYTTLASGGRLSTAAALQGSSQCVSTYKVPPDTPTAMCQAFCNIKFKKFHCMWCKCRACDFCAKGLEAIAEAARDAPPPSPPSEASFVHQDLDPLPPPAELSLDNATGLVPSANQSITDTAIGSVGGTFMSDPLGNSTTDGLGQQQLLTSEGVHPANGNALLTNESSSIMSTAASTTTSMPPTGSAVTSSTAAGTVVADRVAELEALLMAAKAKQSTSTAATETAATAPTAATVTTAETATETADAGSVTSDVPVETTLISELTEAERQKDAENYDQELKDALAGEVGETAAVSTTASV